MSRPRTCHMTTIALSYEDLAARIGVTVASVRRMAYRHRWHKTRGNDGRTLVHVPDEYFSKRDSVLGACHKTGHEAEPKTDPMASQMAALVAQLAAIRDELSGMAQRLAASEARASASEAVLDVERQRINELRQERDELRTERDNALERLNRNIDRLDRVQAEHYAEIATVRDQLARAESDRNRAIEALAAHSALPW